MRQPINLPKERREEIIGKLKSILERHTDISFSYVYGSFTEGISFRDIDIAVYLTNHKNDAFDVLGYEQSIAQEIMEAINIPVDVRIINNAPMGFSYYVTCGRILTCKNDESRCDFVERIWIEYLDYQPKVVEFMRDMYPIEGK